MNLNHIWIVEIHNNEEYEDYQWETLVAFNTFEEAEKFISSYGYTNINSEICLNGIYVRENWIHNNDLLQKFDENDCFFSGYIIISKIPMLEGE